MKNKNQKIFPHASLLMYIEIVVGGIVSFVCIYIFLLITQLTLSQEINLLDRWVQESLYVIRNPWLTQLMVSVSWLGREILIIIAASIIVYFLKHNWYKEGFLLGLILFTSWIFGGLIKEIIQRPRPDLSPLILEGTYSYPSGHVLISLVFYATLAYLFLHYSHYKKFSSLVYVVVFTIVSLIAFSRLYLGVHYLSDVLAGSVAGMWWFISMLVVRKVLESYGLLKKLR